MSSNDPKKTRKLSTLLDNMASEISADFLPSARFPVVFKQLYLLSDWIEPGTTTRLLTVAILLPSGICAGQI